MSDDTAPPLDLDAIEARWATMGALSDTAQIMLDDVRACVAAVRDRDAEIERLRARYEPTPEQMTDVEARLRTMFDNAAPDPFDLVTAERDRLRAELRRDHEAGAEAVVAEALRASTAEAERDRLQAALDRVKALHRPVRVQTGSKTHGGEPEYGDVCAVCGGSKPYPCPTAAALTSEGTDNET